MLKCADDRQSVAGCVSADVSFERDQKWEIDVGWPDLSLRDYFAAAGKIQAASTGKSGDRSSGASMHLASSPRYHVKSSPTLPARVTLPP